MGSTQQGMGKKVNRLFNTTCMLFLTGAFCLFAAGVTQAATMVSVKVTVLAPLPCVINGNQPIEVNFGDEVMTTRVDGENYRTLVDYSVTCDKPEKNGMRLLIAGTGAVFDGKLLQTNVGSLGIAFLNNDARIELNSWQNFTFPVLPKLEAVPVKQANATLPTGEFTASATLRVDYQ
ncbi:MULTISPECIES: fimbrial protein [Serratia]|uniref:fimbrial protein n=1 Tax=Serratia TaxID=613 RepID=UPI000A79F6EE|nr:fimbrial protein [Serratia marcescens]MDP0520357.1 fimbrial protein [Serratia marcescens]MDP8668179.1 fimbrial protein [Serratia marcescens]MDP8692840.1 fimbrial protein [Serratia marcescens]MDP8722503.1 fimbrial protein [Serratia marcescens]MDV2098725.1 fimbrial protein [Serratia marcescens]